ncbi:MAG: hypothetical protein JWL84_1418 [Rhodospirillales bacterium]|nr:hypothetical protein [Rhodospirillales bacterium]
MLGLSFLFEGASWRISLKEFRAGKGSLGYLEAVRRSKDPTSSVVLLEDSAALIGILIALIGTYASGALRQPVFDGLASIGIGLVLAVTSMLLARESKSLLIGEAARPAVVRSICRLAAEQPGIERVNGVITVQMAPHQVFVALSVDFADHLLLDPLFQIGQPRRRGRVREAADRLDVPKRPRSPVHWRVRSFAAALCARVTASWFVSRCVGERRSACYPSRNVETWRTKRSGYWYCEP